MIPNEVEECIQRFKRRKCDGSPTTMAFPFSPIDRCRPQQSLPFWLLGRPRAKGVPVDSHERAGPPFFWFPGERKRPSHQGAGRKSDPAMKGWLCLVLQRTFPPGRRSTTPCTQQRSCPGSVNNEVRNGNKSQGEREPGARSTREPGVIPKRYSSAPFQAFVTRPHPLAWSRMQTEREKGGGGACISPRKRALPPLHPARACVCS